MMNRIIRQTASSLELLLVASILTTCGDEGSSSKDDRGVFGDMADALQSVEDTVLTANAALYASADYLQPFIESLLELNARKITAVSGSTSCLMEGLGGRIYTINGEPFTSAIDPLIPDYTARFRLFNLSTAGQPLLDQEIGHIDYSCVDLGVPVTEVQLFDGSILVASTTYSPTSGLVSGTLRSRDAAVSLVFLAEPQPQGHLNYHFIAGDFEVDKSVRSVEFGSAQFISLTVSIAPATIAPETFFDIRIPADSVDNVSDGWAFYTEGSIMRGAACILSGTIETPVFSQPTNSCFSRELPLLTTSLSEREAMLEIYESSRAYWLRATAQTEICRSLVPENRQ